MTERDQFTTAMIYLMKQEIECLRSVLSEFDGDKRDYIQMVRADIIQAARENLEFKL